MGNEVTQNKIVSNSSSPPPKKLHWLLFTGRKSHPRGAAASSHPRSPFLATVQKGGAYKMQSRPFSFPSHQSKRRLQCTEKPPMSPPASASPEKGEFCIALKPPTPKEGCIALHCSCTAAQRNREPEVRWLQSAFSPLTSYHDSGPFCDGHGTLLRPTSRPRSSAVLHSQRPGERRKGPTSGGNGQTLVRRRVDDGLRKYPSARSGDTEL